MCEQGAEPLLAVDQRPGAEILAVEMQQIEQIEDEGGGVAGIGGGLNDAEGGDAARADAAQFAVEIGLLRAERGDGFGGRRIFVRPVEPGAGQQLDRAVVEPRMHAVAVIFDFVQPVVAFRRGVDQLGQLWPDPLRQRDRLAAPPARYAERHDGSKKRLPGRSMRLLEVIDFAGMLGRPARPASWKARPLTPATSCGMPASCGSRVIV